MHQTAALQSVDPKATDQHRRPLAKSQSSKLTSLSLLPRLVTQLLQPGTVALVLTVSKPPLHPTPGYLSPRNQTPPAVSFLQAHSLYSFLLASTSSTRWKKARTPSESVLLPMQQTDKEPSWKLPTASHQPSCLCPLAHHPLERLSP